ncbi:hypothetical protein MGMO_125c00070 [Methyloglobulus morosus KoM1]|uniref:Uncharacterized protein n=1 Tax=Methyloglobulus morosus KoM1 TaxID=1116472 RepID=V5C025_9GAMM|nr:hypothetical protein [Methyloglobulus morosus]ESS70133.1 hypothetical protein MGMO_125c00070 [Methyloglobulus morosus KoM1]
MILDGFFDDNMHTGEAFRADGQILGKKKRIILRGEGDNALVLKKAALPRGANTRNLRM